VTAINHTKAETSRNKKTKKTTNKKFHWMFRRAFACAFDAKEEMCHRTSCSSFISSQNNSLVLEAEAG